MEKSIAIFMCQTTSPYCAMHLKELFCKIIKIEGPGKGDYARTMIHFILEAVNRDKEASH